MNKKELVDLCRRGDKQALSLLYTTYAAKMMRLCRYYASDSQVAQDLLHDGFIMIFSSIYTLRQPEKLESWMAMIMKNICLKYINHTNGACLTVLTDEHVAEMKEPSDIIYDDFSTVSHDQIIKAIETLPEGYRNVFKLSVLDGMSHKEIGSLLGIAPHSSSSQLARAKIIL